MWPTSSHSAVAKHILFGVMVVTDFRFVSFSCRFVLVRPGYTIFTFNLIILFQINTSALSSINFNCLPVFHSGPDMTERQAAVQYALD